MLNVEDGNHSRVTTSGSIVKDGARLDFGAGGRVHDIPDAFGRHSFDRGRDRGRQSLESETGIWKLSRPGDVN